MTRPDFTKQEEYAIVYVCDEVSAPFNWRLLGLLLISALIAGYGLFAENTPMLLSGFLLVWAEKLIGLTESSGDDWTHVWSSIVQKYEAAIAENGTHDRPAE